MNPPNRIKAVLFDCDGLLVDSETLGMNVANQVCSEFDIALEDGELKTFIGVTDEKWYRDLVTKKELYIDVGPLLARQFELYEAQLPTVKAFPGAKAVPLQLREANYPIALVSGSTRAQIGIVLKSLESEDVFDVIVACEDVGDRSKPDPYGYELALQRLNKSRAADDQIKPEEVLVLEDAVSGIRAALAAGMGVIGVKNAGMQDLSEATNAVNTLKDLQAHEVDTWSTGNDLPSISFQ